METTEWHNKEIQSLKDRVTKLRTEVNDLTLDVAKGKFLLKLALGAATGVGGLFGLDFGNRQLGDHEHPAAVREVERELEAKIEALIQRMEE